MPESISTAEYIRETWDDYNSPPTSTFASRVGHCRSTVGALEEALDYDRSELMKMKKSVKALYSSGNMHVTSETYLAENLEKMGASAMTRENEAEIGAAFLKFAVVTKELSGLMRNMMQNISNILMFPLDSLLKGMKGEMKKPFDKAWKEYETKFTKLEKEKKQIAKDAGMIKTVVTGPEIAEEMEKERRMFQLQMCDYLIKVNEIKTKKGVDLLQHLIEYYHAQTNFFQDGMKTIEHFKCYIEELVSQLGDVKQRQDSERRELLELREAIKSTMTVKEGLAVTTGYNIHQLQGNKAHGYEKRGTLLKKSEGKMRKVWQKRRCVVKDGCLSISHSDSSKEPVKLNLLTCQVKLVADDLGKKCFDLISSSKNRTYHFQADDQQEMEAWISVLNNAKEAVLLQAFGESDNSSSSINQTVKELTRTIIQHVTRLPGNKTCCDCGAPDPEWLSVNLGVLICLECCGVHRQMGVHISRTQSIVIDDLGTSRLLLARVVSNKGFNDIMEATLDMRLKPTPISDMEQRKTFIRAKYEKRKYAIVTCSDIEDRRQDLKAAILTQDICALLQVYAEGIDFMQPLPDMENDETALHLAILQEDGTSLHMVDFIIQNSNSQHLSTPMRDGSTALHLCAAHNKIECMKLLLRLRPDLCEIENGDGQTALDIALQYDHQVCIDILNHVLSGKTELCDNVNIDWDLVPDDRYYDNYDYSDDDLDGGTPESKLRSRPGSLVLSSESTMPLPGATHRERSRTVDSFKLPTGPLGNMSKTLTLPAGIGNIPAFSGSLSTLPKKKGPAPPPPAVSHCRNISDPYLGMVSHSHTRTPSDPPPLPVKMSSHHCRPSMPGAKLVLPPPPEFRTDLRKTSVSKPEPATQTDNALKNKPTIAEKPTLKHLNGSQTNAATQNRSSPDGSSGGMLDLRAVPLGGSSSSISQLSPRLKQPPLLRRCRALYDCDADNDDELSFMKGEIILVLKEEEEQWWEGEIETEPHRRGVFPATFVEVLDDIFV